MNLSVTLIIQGLVFFVVAWLVMKLFWPGIMTAIEVRQKNIAAGLAAANRSQKDLDEAQARAKDIVREARERAAQIVEQAGKRSSEIVEEAKETASKEANRLLLHARDEVARDVTRAREDLRRDVGRLVVEGASRLLEREIDPRAHAQLLEELASEVVRG